MGYTVRYSPQNDGKFPVKKKKTRKARRIFLFLLIALLIAGMIPLQRSGLLRELLIPGDPDVTVAAMETFADNLKDGMSLQTAAEAFCVEIFQNAPIS